MTTTADTVLLVDNDPNSVIAFSKLITQCGCRFHVAKDLRSLLPPNLFLNERVSAVFVNVSDKHAVPLELVPEIRRSLPHAGIVALGLATDVSRLVEAVRLGAQNFIIKPFNNKDLSQVLSDARASLSTVPGVIGESAEFVEAVQRTLALVDSKLPLLFMGELGVGKSKLASLITAEAGNRPVVEVDLTAVPRALIGSRLFGFGKPEAAGASGWLAQADGGFLVLKSAELLPSDVQDAFLRFLKTSIYLDAAGKNERRSSARVLATCTPKIATLVKREQFSRELFAVLGAQVISIPALRDRPADLLPLATFFLEEKTGRVGLPQNGLSPKALQALYDYDFPANVQELESIIEGAALISKGARIEVDHLPPHVVKSNAYSKTLLEEVRYRTIMRVVAECDGNQTEAARRLGLARGTLNRLLKSFS